MTNPETNVDPTDTPLAANLQYTTTERHLIGVLVHAIDQGGSRHWAKDINVGQGQRGMRNYLTATFTDRHGTHQLTLEKLLTGLQVLLDQHIALFAEIIDGSFDAGASDALVQCALFGRCLYE